MEIDPNLILLYLAVSSVRALYAFVSFMKSFSLPVGLSGWYINDISRYFFLISFGVASRPT